MKRQELRTWFNPTNRHEVFPRADVCRHIPFDDEPSLLAQVAIAVIIVLAFVVMMFAPLILQ